MDEIARLLAKLQQIAGRRCCCGERSARVVALVNAFGAALYDRLGIETSNRPTSSAKATADQTLVELRRQILALEMRHREPLQATFTAARHRVEMERRVLAARIVTGADSPALPVDDVAAQPRPGTLKPSPSLDRQLLVAMRRRLADRAHIARSHAAIADSFRLLGLCPLEAACLGG
jgi:hypothetical protein